MAYTTSNISDTIAGTATSSPALTATAVAPGAIQYNEFNFAEWNWVPAGTDSHGQTYATGSLGSGVGAFTHRPFRTTSGFPGIDIGTPVFTFSESGMPRGLFFKTKISGTFTLTYKIIAGGHNPSGPVVPNFRTSANTTGFEHPNGHWSGASNLLTFNVQTVYNTDSFLHGSGTWVKIQGKHGFHGTGSADFNTQAFTEFSVTFTLPAAAYVGFIQTNNGNHHSTDSRWALADVSLQYEDPSVVIGYNTIEVADLASHWQSMQCYLNGEMSASDISTTPWVETFHMKPMRFFGSPAPRIEAVSGDVHYRFDDSLSFLYASQGEDFMPVSGLAVTLHVAPPYLDQACSALVRCCFLAEEVGSNRDANPPETYDVCDFAIFVIQGNGHPQIIDGSLRTLYSRKAGTYIGKKNINMINRVPLSVGVNHVYVGVRFSAATLSKGRAHILRKSMVVDVKYL